MLIETNTNAALMETLERINWHYGRGTIRELQQAQSGDMVATVVKQYGTETPRVSFPRPGFVRFRGQTRKIREHKGFGE